MKRLKAELQASGILRGEGDIYIMIDDDILYVLIVVNKGIHG